jgi:Tfp pilus assembly protein PilX
MKTLPKSFKRLKTQRIKDSLGRMRGKVTYQKKPTVYKGEQQEVKTIKKSKHYDLSTEKEGIFVKSVKGQKPRYYIEKALLATESQFRGQYE